MHTQTLVNIVTTFLASKKFFRKWDNLERGLSKILWKFSLIFYGICYQKQKGPRTNYQPFMTLPNTIFSWNEQIVTHSMSITAFIQVLLESHQKPCNEVESLNLAYLLYSKKNPHYLSVPNLDLFGVRLSNSVPFCKNYLKLYFDSKYLKKGLKRGQWNFWGPFFKKRALFGQYRMLP